MSFTGPLCAQFPYGMCEYTSYSQHFEGENSVKFQLFQFFREIAMFILILFTEKLSCRAELLLNCALI